uniref:Uncharacterized protein n=1 Tax=Aplanochytrium stocchinoi TaxID=215587 RepID=A0A7S3LJY0_9STRA|mmetsp:Transcript_15237/g.17971  ORF Transcript_15237/g.17971 Transcript_15237/m.17971 type:complete len:814 (+) Transcript_15237:68-2509(+)
MKVYIHSPFNGLKDLLTQKECKATNGEMIAIPLRVSPSCMIKDVIKIFLEKITEKIGLKAAPYRIEFSRESCELSGNFPQFRIHMLTEEDKFCALETPLDQYTEDRGDLFIKVKVLEKKSNDSVPSSTPEPETKIDTSEDEVEKRVKAFFTEAEKAKNEKKYKRLQECAKSALLLVDSESDGTGQNRLPLRTQANAYLAFVEFVNKRYENVIKILQPLPEIFQNNLLAGNFNQVTVFELLGDANYGKEKYHDSLGFFRKASNVLEKLKGPLPSTEFKTRRDMLEIKQAKCLLRMDGNEASAQRHAMQILSKAVNDQKPGTKLFSIASLELSQVYYQTGEIGKSLHTSLTALVQDATDKGLKREVSRLLGLHPQLVTAVISMLDSTPASSSSFSFIGTTLKEHSLVEQAKIFMKKSTEASKWAPEYVLNYVHLLELDRKYEDGLTECAEFCRLHKKSVVSVSRTSVSCEEVLIVLQAALNILSGKSASSEHEKKLREKRYKVESIKDEKLDVTLCRVSGAVDSETDYTYIGIDKIPTEKSRKKFSDAELNTLAIWFTVVKLLYLKGLLQFIPPLTALIEPVRVHQRLHLTLVRNEHAYYTLISQLMEYFDDLRFLRPRLTPNESLYVFGDSHSLPLAWKSFKLQGKDREIRPVLATGVKAWHLRKESNFYPKYAFFQGAESIPNNSQVLFIFCEIDCREALAKAVEEAKYISIEEGIHRVVDIYVDTLCELAEKRKFHIYVHPVLPVLDVTRQIVLRFNKILKKRVEEDNTKMIKWINLNILEDDEERVKIEYQLDGTHVNPAYFDLYKDQLRF